MLEKLVGDVQNHGLSGDLSDNRYYRFISAIQEMLHASIPEENYDTTRAATPTDIRQEIVDGVSRNRAVIYLLSNGCEWALKSAHGCTMCGHLGKQRRKSDIIPARDFIHQFESEFEKIDFKQNPLLNLYNNGSFFNDRELPAEARVKILEKIDRTPDIEMLVVETRPEFVTAEKVKEIRRIVSDKHIEIAIGLELQDDLLRRLCLNKGFSLKKYDQAADMITQHVHLRTYVFLKPPFLSEKESIEQAVQTVDYAFLKGSSTVSLEACTVQDFTLVKYLFDHGLYTPPWLWSILQVVDRCRTGKKLIIGLFQFYPSPRTVPYNCPRCSQAVMDAIFAYNRTLDVGVFARLHCQCQKDWARLLQESNESFEQRLKGILDHLAGELNIVP